MFHKREGSWPGPPGPEGPGLLRTVVKLFLDADNLRVTQLTTMNGQEPTTRRGMPGRQGQQEALWLRRGTEAKNPKVLGFFRSGKDPLRPEETTSSRKPPAAPSPAQPENVGDELEKIPEGFSIAVGDKSPSAIPAVKGSHQARRARPRAYRPGLRPGFSEPTGISLTPRENGKQKPGEPRQALLAPINRLNNIKIKYKTLKTGRLRALRG